MDYFQAIILGLAQGLTEFLPVSSSGHLILVPHLFGFEDQGMAMDAMLHLATLLAIIIFFREDLLTLFKSLFNSKADPNYRRLSWSIVAASFPAGIAGLAFGDWIEHNLRSSSFVACGLIFWSVVFFFADRHARKRSSSAQPLESLSFSKVFFIGCAQAIALLPGTSRSGITIAAGLFSQLNQVAAARFSFLLGTPIIMAAGLHKTAGFMMTNSQTFIYSFNHLLVGFIVAFVSGYLSLKLLLGVVSRFGLVPFIVYRVTLAALILIFFN